MIKVLISLITGVVIGAAAALLLAPSSGEELRSQMQEIADADRQRMRAEYQRGMDDLHLRLDKMTSALRKDQPAVEMVEEDVEVDVEIGPEVE